MWIDAPEGALVIRNLSAVAVVGISVQMAVAATSRHRDPVVRHTTVMIPLTVS